MSVPCQAAPTFGRRTKRETFLTGMLLLFFACTCAAQIPYIDVPVVSGPAGQFTCVTTPNPSTIAVITCNMMSLQSFPLPVQAFLLTHEHGHVYQIVYNPQMAMSSYREYDADCYAGAYMGERDPSTLAWAIQWFRQVLGPNGAVDAIHGNGFQMASRALQCAQSVNPTFNASNELQSEPLPHLQYRFANSLFSQQQQQTLGPVSSYARPKHTTRMTDTKFPTVPTDSAPSICTALEILSDTAHNSFWEVSAEDGQIVPNIGKALGGACRIEQGFRRQASCSRTLKGKSEADAPKWSTELAQCLSQDEWKKHCENSDCSSVSYSHPNDAGHHVVIHLERSSDNEILRITRPESEAHAHDSAAIAHATAALKEQRGQ